MGDFFKGWPRKIGCVTLVMALVFTVGWVRSHWIADTFRESLNGCHDEFGSKFGLIYFVESGDNDAVASPMRFDGEVITARTEPIFWGGVVLVVPYGLIVIPLTLVSLWLLLSKPLPSTQQKTALPIRNAGGATS